MGAGWTYRSTAAKGFFFASADQVYRYTFWHHNSVLSTPNRKMDFLLEMRMVFLRIIECGMTGCIIVLMVLFASVVVAVGIERRSKVNAFYDNSLGATKFKQQFNFATNGIGNWGKDQPNAGT